MGRTKKGSFVIVDSDSEEEILPTPMDLQMIDDEKTDEPNHFDHLSLHQSHLNDDDLENTENLEWLMPSLRKSPKISDPCKKAKTSSKPASMRKRQRERKLRLQRMKAAKKAKILFS